MIRPTLVLVAATPVWLAAQSPIYHAANGGLGPETRYVAFQEGIGLTHASQTVVRVFGGVPLGRRVFVDLGSNYAVTRLAASDGTRLSLDGFTDTQARVSYTVGRDRLVASLLLNLPTGTERVNSEALPLVRSIAQNFLPFPVSSHGSGVGATGGLAVAQRLGSWSVGAAGSVRYLASYSPFADVDDRYTPGIETRLRIGVRRAIGRSMSVASGVTISTFGADEFSGLQNYTYRPGTRLAVEAAVSQQVGRSTARLFGWAFFRAAGDSSGATVLKARERIWYGGANWSVPVAGRFTLDPGLDGRAWRAADGASGELGALSVGARVPVASALVLAATLRGERGTLSLAEGVSAAFTGLSVTVFLRLSS